MSAISVSWLNVSWGAVFIETNYGLMQHSYSEIKNRLLRALDAEYNVVDMPTVLEVVAVLEKAPITQEILETTRIAKFINLFRRRTDNKELAKRAKQLLQCWRHMINPTEKSTSKVASSTVLPQQNGTKVYSPNALLARQERVAAPPISPALSVVAAVTSVAHNEASTSSSSSPIRDPKVESVPKTHVANKRLRKAASSPVSGEPPAKVSKMNGAVCAVPAVAADHYEASEEPVSRVTLSDHEEAATTLSPPPTPVTAVSPVAESVPQPDPPPSKRRSRKKSKKKETVEDFLKEKLDAASKAVRVKTTEELVAELKSRTENRLLGDGDASQLQPFNAVKPSLSHNAITDQTDRLDPEARVEQEIASILSKLPPLNVDEIRWDSSPEPPSAPPTPKPLTDEDVDRYLNRRWDDINGCVTHGVPPSTAADSSGGDHNDDGFREWHEMVARRTMNDDLIHILPYCIVD